MSCRSGIRRRDLAALAWPASLVAAWPGAVQAQARVLDAQRPDESPRWLAVRRSLWADRPIQPATPEQLQVSAPVRAPDPAVVPVGLRSPMGMQPGNDPARQVRRLTLVIDQNPSPIAAVFELPPDGALPELETRLRVDEYSFVRGIAETADGQLWQALRYVKASGGCSAPAGGDEAQLAASLGRMLLRATPAAPGQPLTLDWTVQHPNHSGMAMNQATRQPIPAHYLRSALLRQGERLLLSADLDFALSENPSLRLRFFLRGSDPLRAEVVDTKGARFSATVRLPEPT